MVRLTFYGGINEIGGNKILLEEKDRSLLLDFGFPYKRYKLFYEEYLKPRSGAGLLDPLKMELLPPLEGLYRTDYETPNLWQQFRDTPLYRKLGEVDGVLLSHAHLDHSGHISFLKDIIPVYATAATAFITKAMQDSGRADFDQQICYFSPTVQECPAGCQQTAHLANRTINQGRQFCLGDTDPESLSPDAIQFWKETPSRKELISFPLETHTDCSFNLHCFPVDHSIPGACAWGIETSSGWVIYSGDLRWHGKRSELTTKFVEEAARRQPRALVLEGTNILRDTNVTEQEVYENGLKAVAGSRGLVIADFSPRDIDRLLTFLSIAKETDRKLAILPKDAYLLKTMHLLEPDIPALADEDSIVIYQETTASKSPAMWLRNMYDEYDSKIVLAKDVNSNQGQYILCFSFFDLNELPSIQPKPGSLYVYSSSEPHDEEQEIDFRRLHNWLKHFGLQGFGLPVKSNNQWQIPEGEQGLHASGHACGSDLLKIATEIKPEILIPVHSEHPDFYVDHLRGSGIDIVLPRLGVTIEI